MSEGKKVVRVVPTSYKRKVAAENRSVFEEEQKQQRHKSKIAIRRRRNASALPMPLICTGRGRPGR